MMSTKSVCCVALSAALLSLLVLPSYAASVEAKTPHRWRAALEAGIGRDDNVPGSVEDLVDNGVVVTERSDNYRLLSANVDYAYQMPPTTGALNWRWLAGLSVYDRQFQKDVFADFDLRRVAASTGVRVDPAKDWRAEVELTHQILSLGGDELRADNEWAPRLTWSPGQHELSIEGEFSQRHYTDALDRDRDGATRAWRIDYEYALSASTLRYFVGVENERHDTDADALRAFDARYVHAGIRWRVGEQSRFSLKYRQATLDYDGGEDVLINAVPTYVLRDDDETRWIFSWKYDWTKAWGSQLKLSQSDRSSSLDRYNYDRTRVELTISYDL